MLVAVVAATSLTKEPGLPPAIIVWAGYAVWSCRALRGWWHGERVRGGVLASIFVGFAVLTFLLIEAFVLWWGHQHP